MPDDEQVVEPEVMTSGGSLMLATEMKTQRELALSSPRDEASIFKKALKNLESFPDFAEKFYYVLPRGGKQIEGLSVKASRELIRQWKNAATASRIVEDQMDQVIVEGLAVDFETNVIFRRTVVVKKTYIPAESKTKLPIPKRQDNLTNDIQAGCSKAERNAALSMLPEPFKDAYFQKAKEVVGKREKDKLKTPAERKAALDDWFAKLKTPVPKEVIDAYIFKHLPEAKEEEILGHMKGLANAIRDRETTVQDAFGEFMPKTETKAAGAVSGANLSSAKETVTK